MLANSLKILRSGRRAARSGCFVRRELFPLGAADRAEENCVGIAAFFHGGFRKRLAAAVYCGAADVADFVGERVAVLCARGFQHAERGVHNFGPDSVAGQNCKFECSHNICSV